MCKGFIDNSSKFLLAGQMKTITPCMGKPGAGDRGTGPMDISTFG
jgi:ABC-type xylose transport system substrate-binding protein